MEKSERLNLWEDLVIERFPYFSEFYLQQLGHVLTMSSREKSASCFLQKEKKNNYFEMCQSISFFLTRSSLKRN